MSDSNVGRSWKDQLEADPESYRLTNSLPFLRKFSRSPFIQLIQRHAQTGRGSRVLEAGCASGKFSICFAMLGCAVTAFDISPAMLQNVDNLRQEVERTMGPLDVTLVEGDLEQLDLEVEQFDLVFNEGVVEHWLERAARLTVLANMAKMTKRGGFMAIIVPNGQHPFMPRWIKTSPAFLNAPPMVLYTPDMISEDLVSIGLHDLYVDGIYAWRTLDAWPSTHLRRYVAGAFERLIPLPRGLRLNWGIHLIGIGRKP